jgi:Transglycosylase-like domain
MRRALATALSAGVVVAPAMAAKTPGSPAIAPYTRASQHLLARTVLDRPLERMRRRERERRAALRRRRRARAQATVSMPPALAAIAACESGDNPRAIGGGGVYRGAFQFTEATWQSVGGTGDPAAAPLSEQIRRASILYARAGASQWPVCGA